MLAGRSPALEIIVPINHELKTIWLFPEALKQYRLVMEVYRPNNIGLAYRPHCDSIRAHKTRGMAWTLACMPPGSLSLGGPDLLGPNNHQRMPTSLFFKEIIK